MSLSTRSAIGQRQISALVERDAELSTLERCLVQVALTGEGAVIFIGGEAGVGKTALVHKLASGCTHGEHVLYGSCEPLLAPRPFGPFIDLGEALAGDLSELIAEGAKPHAVASALLRDLSRDDTSSLVVLEDLHWADEATLDVVRLTARRLSDVNALMVVTYRNDELGRWHPLRTLIGELGASQRILRMSLTPLSLEAVRVLAAPFDADAELLYGRTDGNPFFVTQLLTSVGETLPDTVTDAVLARAARLSPSARSVLEAIAIAGPQVEPWLLDRITGPVKEELAECTEGGMIISGRGAVSFRHELLREAIGSAVTDSERQQLHAVALQALSEPPSGEPDLARLAHHADGTGDAEAVLQFVSPAAARASKLGAHREAAALYERALSYGDGLPLRARAKLLERRAAECYLLAEFEAAEPDQRQALVCYRQLGDGLREAAALSWLSNLVWETGSVSEAQPMAIRAVEQLERLPPGGHLLSALIQVAQLKLAAEAPDDALTWALRACELAKELGHPRADVGALMTLGWVEFFTGADSGLEKLERAIALADDAGLDADVAGAHVVVARTAARLRRYDLAERHVRAGLDFCDGRDIDLWRYYLMAWQSKLELARGRWDEAARLAEICLGKPCPFSRIHALVALGLVRARRGDPQAWEPLDEALATALPRREWQWIGPVAVARAEAAWLEGRPESIAAEIEPALGFPMRRGDPYAAAVAYWSWRAGLEDRSGAAEDEGDPQRLEIAGDWAAAADRWHALGCPYETAIACAESDDPGRLGEALSTLQSLGARPAAAIVSRRLRDVGVRSIPRGPRRRTRENPGGLTTRELDVLALVCEGLRNAEIAQRLVVSEKTVDHHVSAILRKLEVRTRGEASARAAKLGLARLA
jgi:DNA-binding CsgD family transcriptional regulator/tetratricopeptide (TPR) repeat protein